MDVSDDGIDFTEEACDVIGEGVVVEEVWVTELSELS